MAYTTVLNRRAGLPQTQKDPGSKQVQNNAGGYVYEIDKWSALERFLIIGSDSPTYYATPQKLTVDNTETLLKCLTEDPNKTINTIVSIGTSSRPVTKRPALFALAAASCPEYNKKSGLAIDQITTLCKTSTDLFEYVNMVNGMRGWGRALKRGVSEWYTEKSLSDLEYQVVKYQSRAVGIDPDKVVWSHRDVLRLAHPTGLDENLVNWVLDKEYNDYNFTFIRGFEEAKSVTSEKKLVQLITDYGLTWEMLPTQWLNNVAIWEALINGGIGLTALTRQLGRLSSIGALEPLSALSKTVTSLLTSEKEIKRSKLHPIKILEALKVYERGRGVKGSLTWKPSRVVIDALDSAFYHAFSNAQTTNKNFYLAVDCSGSMSSAVGPVLTARDVAAVMAMVIARNEPNHYIGGFSHSSIKDLPISAKMTLTEAISKMYNFPWGGTDCALPMLDAKTRNMDVDMFVIITDNETWAGNVKPHTALKQYRNARNKNTAKCAVLATTSTGFSIADPSDPGMIDLVGFDSAMPQFISDFAKGK